jgi:hypothetical protein
MSMEVKLSVPHIAHAVASGPYSPVDSINIGSALVNVDASRISYTLMRVGWDLSSWTWRKGSQVIVTGDITINSFTLSVCPYHAMDDGGWDRLRCQSSVL